MTYFDPAQEPDPEGQAPEPQPTQPQGDSPVMRDLRRQAEEGTQAKRELAFHKAGVDTDTPMGQLIASGYKGELTKEAISEFVKGLGPSAAPAPQPQEDPVGQSRDPNPPIVQVVGDPSRESSDRGALAGGEPPGIEPTPDPHVEAVRIAEDAMNIHGKSEEDAMAMGFRHLFGAFEQGDERVMWSPELAEARRQAGM